MKRRERKNMVSFISKVKGTEEKYLSAMTDEDIEHIYEQTYLKHETTE
ncbi:BH0509 family protein [Alteribacillus sp. YIM 98480]|nr:BH0509 family protein [Alteribacillus sp. YIM 98480]